MPSWIYDSIWLSLLYGSAHNLDKSDERVSEKREAFPKSAQIGRFGGVFISWMINPLPR